MVSHEPFKRGSLIKKSDRSLELCSSLELYILGSLDLDFFTSLGVDSLTSCPLDHGKGAETDDLNDSFFTALVIALSTALSAASAAALECLCPSFFGRLR